MAETPTDVLVAGYQDIDEATKDFESLIALVKEKQVAIEGVILVTHAQDGSVGVRQTGDNLGRKGMGWGGGVGLAVGLFAPPLLASVAVGAVAGGVIGRFVDHRVENEIHDKIGENLPPGSAGIIAVFDDEQRLGVEQALSGAQIRSVVQGDKKGTGALKESLAEAMGKFSPDRTVLPIPDPNFGGTIGRTLDASVPDWTINMTPSPPEGAPNILLVLIDDAGFGNPSTFGGPASTPNMTRVAEAGLTYNRFHVTALCSPTRAALLTGRNHHTVGFGSIGELPGPFPGYTASVPKDCAPFVRALQGNGYSTGGFGKWHLTPDHLQGAAGPFDRWPNAWGFDHFWGFLGGETGQYDPVITQDNTTLGVPEGEDGKQYYLPDDLTDQAARWLHTVRAQDQTKPWFIYYSTGCAHAPHQVAKDWSEKYRGKFDQGWDALREETFERQKQLGVIPPDAELTPRPDAFPAWDSLSESEKRLYARQMEVYAGYQENADWNIGRLLDAGRGDGRARQHARALHLRRQRRELGGHDHRLVQRADDAERDRADPRAATFADRPIRRARRLGHRRVRPALRVRLGLGGERSVPVGQAGRLPPRRHTQWHGRHLARPDQGRRWVAFSLHPLHRRGADDPRGGRHPGAQGRGRDCAEAIGGDELPVQLRRRERSRATHRAVLRDLRKPRDLQGRLVGRLHARPHPLGRIAAVDRSIRARRLRPGTRQVGAVLPARRLRAGEGCCCGKPREARRAEAAVLGGGREAQRPAAAGGVLDLLRDPAADAHRHDAHVPRRRPEHCLRDDPPHLRSLVRDRGRARPYRSRVPKALSSPRRTRWAASHSGSTSKGCCITATR